jgi:acyl-CoA synthetase (AMP-forming)/AMP-acid ligase II
MIGRVVDEAAQRFGDATAFVSADGATFGFRDLAMLSDEAAAGLAARGVRAGDVVALVLPSVVEYVVLYAAAAKLGAVTAGVNARLAGVERDRILAVAEPSVVVSTAGLSPGAAVMPEAARLVIEPAEAVGDVLRDLRVAPTTAGTPAPLPPDPDRPVAIVFTSGTTGTPKGALFCERQLDFVNLVDTAHRWAEQPSGHALAGTSFAHLGPMTKTPGNLMRGGATHLVHRWRADEALDLIERHRMAGIGGIPTQVALMLREPGFADRDLDCVQAIVMGGGPATPTLIREARSGFGAAVAVRYSCTEAGIGVGTGFADDPEDAEVSVGRPHDGVELTVIDPDDPAGRAVPDGEVGEICLRSPAVMAGYWQNPDATAAAFTADGALRTGDLGWVDDAGRLRLSGRAREMYVRGGYNVYPVEVEQVLAEHPGVADVAVVSRADDVMGEVGVAVVVPRDPAEPPSLDQLRAFGDGKLAAYKLPVEIAVVDELPLTPMEKVDRRALTTMVSSSDGDHGPA